MKTIELTPTDLIKGEKEAKQLNSNNNLQKKIKLLVYSCRKVTSNQNRESKRNDSGRIFNETTQKSSK